MNNPVVQQVLYYVNGVWRRRWTAIIVAWVVSVMGWAVVASLPDYYESSARIYVDTSNILTPLLKGIAVDDDVQNEISFIERTLTSRPNLEKIARMTDLDITVVTPTEQERLLEKILDRTIITAQGDNLYFVGFQAPNPKLAKNVVQSYLTLFVESNLGQSRQDRDSAREFLDEQILDYERQLNEAETRLAEFKGENAGLLPGERGFQATLSKALNQFSETEEQYRSAIEQRDSLKSQLAQIPSTVEMPLAQAAADSGPPSATESRIVELESQIEQMLQHFTEQHPDVVLAQKRLTVLEEEREAELDAFHSMSPDAKGEVGGDSFSMPNKVYDDVKLQLIQVESIINILKDRMARSRDKVGEMESRAAQVPAVEAALTRLNRDYSVIKKNHDQLLQRRESARLSRAREVKAEEVQFRVVEPPVLPTVPGGPNRALFIVVALVFGIGAGLGVTCLQVVMSGAVSSAAGLKEIFNLPLLGVVSMVESRKRGGIRIAKLATFAVVLALLVGTCASLLLLEQKIGLANVVPINVIGGTSTL